MAALEAPPLVIFPCNGNAVEAVDCLGDRHRLIAFIDDSAEKRGSIILGYPVAGREILSQQPAARLLAVPGSPTSYRARRQIIEGLGVSGERFTTVIHPAATVSRLACIGRNVLIMAGVVITSNAIIGDHVCILPNSVIHHDVAIGARSLIGSSVTIAGGSVVGENCYVGSGSNIMNDVHLGRDCLIGLGSNVIDNVPPAIKVAGNPAHRMREQTEPEMNGGKATPV
jgi:sugar O-acyltransferase (sialic acid O-acetyltransferase NeuD family)